MRTILFLLLPAAFWGPRIIDQPDAQRRDGVPRGKVIQVHGTTARRFPVRHGLTAYIPAQYDPKLLANLMVFQDGGGFVRENGHTRVPIVFDNLIHQKELPVTIGLFVNPGSVPGAESGNQPRRNRAFEYDTVSADNANFIIDELWPVVAKEHNLVIAKDPRTRAIVVTVAAVLRHSRRRGIGRISLAA